MAQPLMMDAIARNPDAAVLNLNVSIIGVPQSIPALPRYSLLNISIHI
jgi:hypothetical protein